MVAFQYTEKIIINIVSLWYRKINYNKNWKQLISFMIGRLPKMLCLKNHFKCYLVKTRNKRTNVFMLIYLSSSIETRSSISNQTKEPSRTNLNNPPWKPRWNQIAITWRCHCRKLHFYQRVISHVPSHYGAENWNIFGDFIINISARDIWISRSGRRSSTSGWQLFNYVYEDLNLKMKKHLDFLGFCCIFHIF